MKAWSWELAKVCLCVCIAVDSVIRDFEKQQSGNDFLLVLVWPTNYTDRQTGEIEEGVETDI